MNFETQALRENFSLFIEQPFPVFEIENFLKAQDYERLNDEFPDKAVFPKAHSRGNKSYLDNQRKEFFKFLSRSPAWSEFYQLFYRPDVVAQFYQLANGFSSERPERERQPWKVIKNPSRPRKRSSSKFHKFLGGLRGYTPVSLGFEFSYLDKGCFIPPHTDHVTKLLSLMVYFPDVGVEYGSNAGTDFFKGSDGRESWKEWRVPMLDERRAAEFYKEHETFHSSLFTGNKLVGFLKTSDSWHGLQALRIPEAATRRSLNINYYTA